MPDKVRTGMALCIPLSGRAVSPHWAFSLRSIDPPINVYCVSFVVEGKPVDEARNWLVEQSLKAKTKYLMFIDEDTIIPPHAVRRFIFHMENNPFIDVVSAVYCSKCETPAPLIFRGNGRGSYWDWKIGEFFWVTGCGMGATMIRTSVFDRIREKNPRDLAPGQLYPYFLTIKADGHVDGVARSEAWTEDLYFANLICDPETGNSRFKANSRNMYCDGSILCDHVDVTSGKLYRLPMNSKPAIRRMAVGKKKILDIGCGEVATLFKDGAGVRFDCREEVNPDYRGDARQLPFASESWDVVFASHVLEHFPRGEVGKVLDEWLRVLKAGGELRLIVPDLTVAAKKLLDEQVDDETLNILYGAQADGFDYHKAGFTPKTLRALLETKGLRVDFVEQQAPLSILIQATKLKARETVGDGEGRAILKSDVPQLAVVKPKRSHKKKVAADPMPIAPVVESKQSLTMLVPQGSPSQKASGQ